MRKLKTIEMNRLSLEEFKEAEKLPLVVVLDDVRSLYNVGSVFRTGDAFRIEAVYLCGITATPPHPEIHKTALGGEDSVAWRYFEHTEDAVRDLQARGYFVYAIEQVEGSTKLQELGNSQLANAELRFTIHNSQLGLDSEGEGNHYHLTPITYHLTPTTQHLTPTTQHLSPAKHAVVFGNEVKGVKQTVVDMCDGCLEIPQFGTKHSLNVSVTAGIVIWEFAKLRLLQD
jgi:tRNA G18 (ribose-2'-O)-methylase SpoU